MPETVNSPSVATSIFACRGPGGTYSGSLFDILDGIEGGELVDLPGMAAHQRPCVVTTLAVLFLALRRYADRLPGTASDWRAEWERQIGSDAATLVNAPDKAAFFQPPTSPSGQPLALWEVDWLFQTQRHEAKGQDDGPPEQWAYALMCSPWRQFGGRGRYGGARDGLLVAFPGDGRTIASEVRSLAEAYERADPGEVGIDSTPASAADHLLWFEPYEPQSGSVPITKCPYPFLDCRAIRLTEGGGHISAYGVSTQSARVGEGQPADPHVPVELKTGGPYKVVKQRSFDYRVQHAALFGSKEVRRARALDLAPPYIAVRLCAMGTDPPGKTRGYWENVLRASRQRSGFRLPAPAHEGDRPAELSQQMLGTLTTAGRNVLWPALHVLTESDEPKMIRAAERFRAATGTPSVQLVLDLLQREPRETKEQQDMNQLAREGVLTAFHLARRSEFDVLRAAEAEGRLMALLRKHLPGDESMPSEGLPDLASRSFAILSEIDAHLTPDERATLRTMRRTEPRLSAWMALAAVPPTHLDDEQAREVWLSALIALGQVRHGNDRIGRVLATTEFPRDRMQRLLMATGTALVGYLDEAVNWLISHDLRQADLSSLVTLGLADALGDVEARDWARRHIALDYARVFRRAEQRTQQAAE